MALLQEVLRARDVLKPGASLFPPRARAIKMRAPLPHRHAGPTIRPRLHRVTMKNVTIDSLGEHEISQRLDRIRIVEPTTMLRTWPRGERFRADDRPSINVADRRREL